jgi:predicted ArsR family transcriptional regulator
MSVNELGRAAKNGFAMYGSLAKELMTRHGEKMVYEAVEAMGESSGPIYGEWTNLGAKQYAEQLLESQRSGGWSAEVKVDGGKVTLINHTCPCYSGMREGGLTHEQAKKMCYSWWKRLPESAKKVNHSIKNMQIERYRSNESDYCLETFELEK